MQQITYKELIKNNADYIINELSTTTTTNTPNNTEVLMTVYLKMNDCIKLLGQLEIVD